MKSSFYKTFLIVLLGALIILLSLHFLSKTPPVNQDEISVKRAKAMFEKGEIMPAVKLLKQVLEKDENNLDAIWELGKRSMQSNQYSKAIERFEKFSQIAEGNDKISGLIYLSDAYYLNGKIKESLESLHKAEKLTEDEKMTTEIKERINRIQQFINTNQSEKITDKN